MSSAGFWLVQVLVAVSAYVAGLHEAKRLGEASPRRALLYAGTGTALAVGVSLLAGEVWPAILVIMGARFLAVPPERRSSWLAVLLIALLIALPVMFFVTRR